MQKIKCVVVGSCAVGKTCLISVYTTGTFPREYIWSRDWDWPDANMLLDGKLFQISIWDTAGQDDYDRLRPLSYPDTDIFLLCFAINSRDSFHALERKFYHEIHFYSPATPFIIVGMKNDLRMNDHEQYKHTPQNMHFVTSKEGHILCAQLNGYKYIETSALEQINLTHLFDQAVRATYAEYATSNATDLFNSYQIRINRQRFDKHKIYDLNSFIFMIVCVIIDMLLTVRYVISIIRLKEYHLLSLYHFYSVFIFCPVCITVVCKYRWYIKHTDENKYRETYSRKTWNKIVWTFIILFVLIPFLLFCATFSIVSYLLYHFVYIKFPLDGVNTNLYMDLFTMLKTHKDDIHLKMIVNNELNAVGIIQKDLGICIELNEIIQNKWTENTLRSMVIDNESRKDSSFIKYLWFNVYNSLLVFDYDGYHKQKMETNYEQSNKCYAVFYLLFLIFILAQFSRIIFCIYYHELYYIALDVLFILLGCVAVILFFKNVLPFYLNIWQIGYNHPLQRLQNNVEEYAVQMFAGINQQYENYRTEFIKQMLILLLGSDIAATICSYLRSNIQ